MKNRKTYVGTDLDKETHDKFLRYCKKHDRSKSKAANILLKKQLEAENAMDKAPKETMGS